MRHKPDLSTIPGIHHAIESSEAKLNGQGRVLVRYSGTETLLRIMVEGPQDELIRTVADDLATVVRSHLA